MDVLYNWLLHNTGNEGNFLTVLNVQRHTEDGVTADLRVMARNKDFTIVNLLIKRGSETAQPAISQNETAQETHFFDSENQVITYLSEGKIAESIAKPVSDGVNVHVFTPTSNVGEISFPAQ